MGKATRWFSADGKAIKGSGFSAGEKRKLKKVAVLAYRNSIRIHEDSVLLFRKVRYASAFALSVIAAEEYSKYDHLGWAFFYGHFDLDRSWALKILEDTYSHRLKQRRFAFRNDVLGTYYQRPKYEKLAHELEGRKQNALYVGFDRRAGVPYVEGRIRSPFRINKREVARQITAVNDLLLTEALGVLKGTRDADFEEVSAIMTGKLVSHLQRLWPMMEREGRRLYNKLIELDDFVDEDDAFDN